MKKLFYLILFTVLVLTGCKQEQSSFSIESIKGKATVTGVVSYNMGQSYVNGKFVEDIKNATGKKVYVDIDYADLSPIGMGTGCITYEGEVQSDGTYSIGFRLWPLLPECLLAYALNHLPEPEKS